MSVPQAAQNFYRSFSDSNAGGLVSGKGKGGRQLSIHELLSEFKNHKTRPRNLHEEIYPKRLTALVSVTVSFIDVLRRAFNKLYKGEEPDQIWIVFISVPYKDKSTYYHLEHLAREIGQDKPSMFKDEYIFVWEIPEEYIVHKVSVQTLLERGLNMERYCEYSNNRKQLPSAYLLRQDIAKNILDPSNGGYDIGMSLGFMARCFGARALVCDIAHKILFECTRTVRINDDAQYVYVYMNGHETILDFEHFFWIDKGIDEALIEMWLNGPDFCLAYAEHCEWVSRLEDEMEREWEKFTGHINDDDFSYSEQRQRTLQAREDKIQAEIELAATKLGL